MIIERAIYGSFVRTVIVRLKPGATKIVAAQAWLAERYTIENVEVEVSNAEVVKLADTYVSGAYGETHGGSSPPFGIE